MRYIFLLITVSIFYTFSFAQQLQTGEGFIEVEGGRIWYKVMGKGNGIPLLHIHGGPGSNSCRIMEGYALLGNERKVIMYDQLGSGKSDRPSDTTLWKTERFVDEIVAIRKALGLKKLHIIGHSWGGTVLAEYMITKKPAGIASVIFSGPLLSTTKWMEDAKILLSKMPQYLQDTIARYEEKRDYKTPAYLAATDSFYARYLTVKKSFDTTSTICEGFLPFNEDVYNYMWGPTEFTAVGTLKNYDRTADLNKIKVPVIFIAGEFDEARPETMYYFQKLVPGSSVEIIKDAGHMTILDQPVAYTNAIRIFLKQIESTKK